MPLNTPKRRRRVVIDKIEAWRRIQNYAEISEANLHLALAIMSALESGNDIVRGMADRPPFYGAQCYNTLKQSLSVDLSLAACRLFDAGSKRYSVNNRDAASLPALIRLLRQKRCKSLLTYRSRNWIPAFAAKCEADCTNSIEQALKAYSAGRNSPKGIRAYKSLKEFRDKVLAHSLLDKRVQRHPKYEELFYLIEIAKQVVEHATLAIHGRNLNLEAFANEYRRDADAFWSAALPAAISANR